MRVGRRIKGRELRQLVEAHIRDLGPAEGRMRAYAHLEEALEQKHLRPDDFSIRDLFAAFVGDASEALLEMSPKAGSWAHLMEAGQGNSVVGIGDFSNIVGQIMFTEVLEKYGDEENVFSKLVESKASTIQDMERIPGITRIGDDASIVGENEEYPILGVGEDYIDVARKRKRGAIIPVSTEAVRGDKTGALLERCGELALYAGRNIEKRIIDAIIDEGAGATSAFAGGHRYTWKGTAYSSWQTSTPWINVQASNALVDETDIDNLWQVIIAITDPFTGEPLDILPDTLIVSPNLFWAAHRIVRATNIQTHAGGYNASTTVYDSHAPAVISTVLGKLNIVSSQLLKTRLATDTDWFLGNPRKAVRRYYNWDVTPQQRGAGTDAEFYRDVVAEYKVSWMDCVSVIQPRAMAKSTVA